MSPFRSFVFRLIGLMRIGVMVITPPIVPAFHRVLERAPVTIGAESFRLWAEHVEARGSLLLFGALLVNLLSRWARVQKARARVVAA